MSAARDVVLGHLHDDLNVAASAIFQRSFVDTVAVWVDDANRIYGRSATVDLDVPTHWLVGTFAAGASIQDIISDLRTTLRERAKDWIID